MINKQAIIAKYGSNAKDSGLPEVQVAILTEEIKNITFHLQTNKNDLHLRRGLMKKISTRARLLKYLHRLDSDRYSKIIQELDLRK